MMEYRTNSLNLLIFLNITLFIDEMVKILITWKENQDIEICAKKKINKY